MGSGDWICGILGFLPQRFLADTVGNRCVVSCASVCKLVTLKYFEIHKEVAFS